jgi:hypothetical protein
MENLMERRLGKSALVLLRNLPSHMWEATLGYLLYGYPIGDFMSAVMENDLKESFARADWINEQAMKRWAEFLYGVMPVSPVRSFGSKEVVKEWQRIGGLEGLIKSREDSLRSGD